LTDKKRARSEALFAQAQEVLVGGVNSPVRAFRAVGGTPVFIESAKGARMKDVDGNSYLDFVASWGPIILGHAPAVVADAIRDAALQGTSYGAPTEREVEMARLIRDAFPSMETVRFTSSGTEATMAAMRLARAVTKRERIVKFEGGYHGHSDGLLVAAGSGATTFGVPSSAGVPGSWARRTWVLPYNDVAAVENIFRTQGPNIAAVIIEPVSANMGVVEPDKAFLNALRKLCTKHGALLVFDEVVTGFRVGWNGAQGHYGVTPDLTCLGKIIGGGLPVGAFGGSTKLMKELAPLGPVYHAGTLSGNPVAMAAGLATLRALKATNPYADLAKKTAALAGKIDAAAKKHKVPVRVNHLASMFTVFFTGEPVTNYLTATASNARRYAAFFHALLDAGVYFPPSQFEAAFLSTAHTDADLATAAAAIDAALGVAAKKR
jgi:glutamate-1-semialdehyde 2,1-aminomutase